MQPAGPLSKGGPAFFLPSVVGTFILELPQYFLL